MPTNKTHPIIENENETTARVNALNQLLEHTRNQVIKAYEGQLPLAEYKALKARRQAWLNELAELNGDTGVSETALAPDVLLATIDGLGVASIMFVLEAQSESSRLDNVTIAEHADLFPTWTAEWRGNAGSIVRDDGLLYRSIHDVTNAGQNTKPSQTPAMWTEIGDPAEEWPDWRRPIGAHDAYALGDKVSHDGKRWTSDLDNNVWAPGEYGWTEVNE